MQEKTKNRLTRQVLSIISMSKGVSHPAYPWQQFSNLSVVVHDLVRAPYAHAPYGSCHAMPWHSHEPSPTGGHQAESLTVATLSIWHRTCSRCLAVFSLNSCPYRKCFWLQKGKPTTLGFVRPEQKKKEHKKAPSVDDSPLSAHHYGNINNTAKVRHFRKTPLRKAPLYGIVLSIKPICASPHASPWHPRLPGGASSHTPRHWLHASLSAS